MNTAENLYGVMAQFDDPDILVAATKRAYEAGYRKMDAFSPFLVEGLAEALGRRGTAVPLIVLIGGIVGGCGGYFMEWFATTIHYPLNIGGRPFHSWPAYIPITFELTVLCASLSALVAMLALNHLPEPYHPVFNAPGFERASQDRFFLCIEAADPKFDRASALKFLESLGALQVTEVSK